MRAWVATPAGYLPCEVVEIGAGYVVIEDSRPRHRSVHTVSHRCVRWSEPPRDVITRKGKQRKPPPPPDVGPVRHRVLGLGE